MLDSNASLLATLPRTTRAKVLSEFSSEEIEEMLHDWRFWGRPNQLTPPGDWYTWLIMAGRGAGKTRSGAEWIRERIKSGEGRAGLIAPTAADARHVMVEGESGLLGVCWERDRTYDGTFLGRPIYEPSKRQVTWANGATATLYSAEKPERLRGPQHGSLWADELAAWRHLRYTWDMALFGLRLGAHPRIMVTTTPKPLSLLRELVADKKSVVSTGSTYDNAANLAPVFLQRVRDKYEGTRLGQQELYAQLLSEAEGALWTLKLIEKARCKKDQVPEMQRIVVAVDPAITANEGSNEVGIVAAGLGVDDKGYVLEDGSGIYTPGEWAKKTVKMYQGRKADRIVAESNQGGLMVKHTIHTEDRSVPVKLVHASKGKQARAEPVVALYEQGRVKHVENFSSLEDQLVNWEPSSGMESPDRLDALVWALTELMLTGSMVDDKELRL